MNTHATSDFGLSNNSNIDNSSQKRGDLLEQLDFFMSLNC